jgi:hypothetical protein
MIKKLVITMMSLGLAAASFAASNAADNALDAAYSDGWAAGDNGGTGFGAWTITDGDGGHYVGGTGLSAGTDFGLFNTFTTTTTEAVRPFTGTLAANQTFSLDLGFTPYTSGGSVGFNLRSGTTELITLFTTGTGDWVLNDGGGNFSAGAAATGDSPYTFTFTYLGGNNYSFTLTGSAGGTNFSATSTLTSIDNVRFFNFNQGPDENFGFDNLAIVPEPSTLSLLAGPAILGVWFYVRRRRTS